MLVSGVEEGRDPWPIDERQGDAYSEGAEDDEPKHDAP
jgi:hypothetical protein